MLNPENFYDQVVMKEIDSFLGRDVGNQEIREIWRNRVDLNTKPSAHYSDPHKKERATAILDAFVDSFNKDTHWNQSDGLYVKWKLERYTQGYEIEKELLLEEVLKVGRNPVFRFLADPVHWFQLGIVALVLLVLMANYF